MAERTQKILHITHAQFPPAIRVVKEALSLCKAGYQTAVLCPPYGEEPEYEIWNGVEIFRPKILGQRSVLEKIFEQAAFFGPSWYLAIRRTMAHYLPDALHVHDIWLGRVAFAARDTQMLVMDLHENMPAAVVEYRRGYRGPQRWFRTIFHSHQRVFALESSLLQASDLVISVVREARDRILSDHRSLPLAKVVNVENLESKQFIARTELGQAAFMKDHFSILYIGGFGPHRGIDTLIRAMVPIKELRRNIKVQLIGAVPSQYLVTLKALINEVGVSDHVQISGWVRTEDVLANIQQADVCCVPHHSNSHTDSTIPHKLFQYMIAKRPVLVSSSGPLARSVRQSGAGLIFNAGDPMDCAAKILELANCPASRSTYAESGHRYVMEQGHNWEDEAAPRLIQAYENLFTRNHE